MSMNTLPELSSDSFSRQSSPGVPVLAGAAPRRVALIGYGAVTRMVSRRLRELQCWGEHSEVVVIVAVLVRPERAKKVDARDIGPNCSVVLSLEELLDCAPELVVECASQDAVRDYGEAVLRAGVGLMVLSTGALADDTLRARLSMAAGESGSQILVPAATVAGLDGLGSLKAAGLQCVKFTLTRPPSAWHIESYGVRKLFNGSAREAAERYPNCSDFVATVALAGMGFDATEVELVSDASVARTSVSRIEATGACGHLVAECKGPLLRDNRKPSKSPVMTESRQASLPAAMSVVYALLRNTGALII